MTTATIEHVVVLMLENRSFDHMLGLLPNRRINGLLGTDGTSIDPSYTNAVTGRGAGQASSFPAQPGATYTTGAEQIDKQGFGGPAHSFPAATQQLFDTHVAPAGPAPRFGAGFAQSYYQQLKTDVHLANPTDAEIAVPMCAFGAGQLPTLWQLAQAFCVCDNWYSEVPGPTQPNRLFTHAATSGGFTHNVWSQPFNVKTIYDELDKAGHDWGVYYFDLRDSDSFPQVKKRIDRVQPFPSFLAQAKGGTLPSYSFLCPRYNEPKVPTDPPPNSEHAPYDVRNGENLIADVYEALRAGPGWAQTLLVVTYDEHGGYFDHVMPPSTGVANPDGLTSPTAVDRQAAKRDPKKNGYLLQPDYQFDFTRLGLRVPTLLISPWVPAGAVLKQPLQHTSVLATLRELFGIGTLTKRDAQAASFASALSLGSARSDAPTTLNRPALVPVTAKTAQAPLTHQQTDMWPLLSQLDGHKDSGKVTPPPATRQQAADYIAERIAAHDRFHRARRRKASYVVSRSTGGRFGWVLKDEAGKPLASAARLYETQAEAEAAVAKVRDLGPFARQFGPKRPSVPRKKSKKATKTKKR